MSRGFTLLVVTLSVKVPGKESEGDQADSTGQLGSGLCESQSQNDFSVIDGLTFQSQAVDVAALKKTNLQTILNVVMVMGFLAHGQVFSPSAAGY